MARPTDSPTTPPMVIRDLDGLLSAVPALLGFHPTESAVFICLTGPNRRLGPVVRADLPADSSPYAFFDAVVQLVGNTRRHADQVVIVFYTDQPDVIDLGVVWETVESLGMSVYDVRCVGNAPRPVTGDFAAATALSGRAVLPSRAELAQSVEHRPGVVAPAVVMSSLLDVASRDALIARLMPEQEAVATLVTAAQGTPDVDNRTADLCAVLAMCAYRHGDGALAQAAADRALRCRPAHRLAHLMISAMAAGIAPSELASIVKLTS